ncbi:MAG: rhomboid family intramembrane serine protease [Bacteroidetes bacterium]|nr:MAG: rhomboid family intramembrane serine protease [Bacteroidota bacterium]
MDIWGQIKRDFRFGSNLTKLIYLNIAVFLIIKIFYVFLFLFRIADNNIIIYWLSLPANFSKLLIRPWTIITYQFLHEGFLHILFNMLWLYWFGKIFIEFLSQKKLVTIYLLGGIFGGLFFIITYNIFPVFAGIKSEAIALGASASVLAIVTTISFYVPNYTIRLMFIGDIKLKYIALFSILLDILSIAGENSGGHIAHLGGAFFGFLMYLQLKQDKNINFLDNIWNGIANLFKSKPKMRVDYKTKKPPRNDYDYNKEKAKKQKQIDVILDKISKSGYNSLSKKEKEILFSASKKNK